MTIEYKTLPFITPTQNVLYRIEHLERVRLKYEKVKATKTYDEETFIYEMAHATLDIDMALVKLEQAVAQYREARAIYNEMQEEA